MINFAFQFNCFTCSLLLMLIVIFQRGRAGDPVGPGELGDRVRGGGEAGGLHQGQPGRRQLQDFSGLLTSSGLSLKKRKSGSFLHYSPCIVSVYQMDR